MPRVTTLKDSNYNRGMNTCDDPKALSDGECVEMINAFPDFPLKLRKGCSGKVILGEGNVFSNVQGKPFCFGGADNAQHVLFWATRHAPSGRGMELFDAVFSNNGEFLRVETIRYLHNAAEPISFSAARGVSVTGFVPVGDIIYTRIDIQETIGGTPILIAIEFSGGRYRGRRVPFSTNSFQQTLSQTDALRYAADPLGIFVGNFAYGYSITLVRRVGSAPLDSYVPGVIETPEAVGTRGSIIRDDADSHDKADIYLKQTDFNIAPIWGFTHVRLYRTDNLYSTLIEKGFNTDKDRRQFINGAPRKFLMDIPIADWADGVEIKDVITEAAIMGEMNLMAADQYAFPPTGFNKMCYFKDRMFLLGGSGSVYFSEIPGGDGGGSSEFAQVEYNKYALWFKPLHYRIDLDIEERTPATGIIGHGDDLFMFKTNRAYMIISGDPLLSPLRRISDDVGCLYGDSLINAKISEREVLFFVGNLGPMLLHAGGDIRPFTGFKIAEFWPDSNGELVKTSGHFGVAEWCTAAFWDNAIWIFYKIQDQAPKIFLYTSKEEIAGASEIRLASLENKYEISSVVVLSNNKAISISDVPSLTSIASVDFLGSEQSEDTLKPMSGDTERARVEFQVLSRKIYPGPKEMSISELYSLVAYCKFRDDPTGKNPFKIGLMSNRYKSEEDFYSEKSKYTSNQLGASVPVARWGSGNQLVREDGGRWTPHSFTDYVAYIYNKDRPHDGIFVDVRDNDGTTLTLAAVVDEGFGTVSLIGRPITRLNFQVAPRAGFIGEYFQYGIKKAIPYNRDMSWYGVDLQVIPRPNLDISESLIGGNKVANSWEEVVESPPSPSPILTFAVDPLGSGTVRGDGVIDWGSTVTVTASPTAGWEFAYWTFNGSAVVAPSVHSFTINQNTAVVAHFVRTLPAAYALLLSAQWARNTINRFTIRMGATEISTENGAVVMPGLPAGVYEVSIESKWWTGQSVTIEVSANTTHVFDLIPAWDEIDESGTAEFIIVESSDAQATIVEPHGESLSRHTVTTSVDPAGSGTITGGGTYNWGDTVTITTTPEDGFNFAYLMVNGVPITTPNHTFTITGDVIITAHFIEAEVDPDRFMLIVVAKWATVNVMRFTVTGDDFGASTDNGVLVLTGVLSGTHTLEIKSDIWAGDPVTITIDSNMAYTWEMRPTWDVVDEPAEAEFVIVESADADITIVEPHGAAGFTLTITAVEEDTPPPPPANPYSWYTDDPSAIDFYIWDRTQLAAFANIVNGTANAAATLIPPPSTFGAADIPAFNFLGRTAHVMPWDIDLSVYDNWAPIGTVALPFSGSFICAGKSIKNMRIDRPNSDNVGFFGVIRGFNIIGLKLVNVDINGRGFVGGLSGSLTSGIIEDVEVSGTINGSGSEVGGIIGNSGFAFSYSGEGIRESSFIGSIKGLSFVGGIVGGIGEGAIEDCFSIADIVSTGTSWNVSATGGIAGHNRNTPIRRCYAAGKIRAIHNYVAGVAGYPLQVSPTVDCVSLVQSVVGNSPPTARVAAVNTVMQNCAAFEETLNSAGNTDWSPKGLTTINGADISAAEINADGTLGGRFTPANGWMTQNGKLPGRNRVINMPDYLKEGA